MKEQHEMYAFLANWHIRDCESGRREEDMTVYHTYDRLAQALIDNFEIRRKSAVTNGDRA